MELLDLYLRFRAEEKKWKRAGKPMRSPARMLEIYTICQSCPEFEKGGGWLPGYDRCKICKCNLHPSSTTMNKIAWATTHCPADQPLWREE